MRKIGAWIVLAGLFAAALPAAAAQDSGTTTQQDKQQDAQKEAPQDGQSARPRQMRVRVSQGVAAGLLIKKVNPSYPPDAREAKIQGVVLLHVMISRDGDVTSVELISGAPELAPAAIDAVKQWRYRPYQLNGESVEVDTQVQVSFTLRH
jgi:TonB family protein